MGNFINFEEQVSSIRINASQEIDRLFIENNIDNIQIDSVFINSENGIVEITECEYVDGSGVTLTDEFSVSHMLMDLDTDDIIAIYEEIWFNLNKN